MATQLQSALFGDNPSRFPDGFLFWEQFITPEEEAILITKISALEFSPIELHGVVAQRRAAHFGMRYSYETKKLSEGLALPEFLLPYRERFARHIGMHAEDFPQALINEYTPGAAIGWHIDGPVYEIISGFSIVGNCQFKLRPLRPQEGNKRRTSISFDQPARSAYVMSGDARWNWQHSIPPTNSLRYSITFRSLRLPRSQSQNTI
jgi:alkylated DNA repair dioxygenase AlkB